MPTLHNSAEKEHGKHYAAGYCEKQRKLRLELTDRDYHNAHDKRRTDKGKNIHNPNVSFTVSKSVLIRDIIIIRTTIIPARVVIMACSSLPARIST